jgi:hypothetical protein
MSRPCAKCRASFEVDSVEIAFLERVSPVMNGAQHPVPQPSLCPACREQRRMCWRNERSLYGRSCDKTGANLVSAYPPATPFPVYDSAEWWKEENNALSFGREIDFEKPFFEQLAALMRVVPRAHTFNYADERLENSRYTNCAGDLKNCYLVFGAGRDERCCYSTYINDSYLCFDCFFAMQSRGCYECVDVLNCDHLFYSQSCSECHDAWHLYDCRGCSDCIACAGLRRKQYCILNQAVGRTEFFRQKTKILGDPKAMAALFARYQELKRRSPRRCYSGDQNENVAGDAISRSRNCWWCFDANNAEDCRYCTWFMDGKDCMDFTAWGEAELCYEVAAGGDSMYHSLFTAQSFGCRECLYTDLCVYCRSCFGCVGLKNEQYCILNRRCTEKQYLGLVPRLIELMRANGEWGEFFPAALSPHCYNETIAQEYHPLTRSEALALGMRWLDYKAPAPAAQKSIAADALPQRIADVDASILDAAIICEATAKPFRLTREELEFYRTGPLPLPRRHPEQRHADRRLLRNPRWLWRRSCAGCGAPRHSSYAPARPEQVFCEECYLKLVP